MPAVSVYKPTSEGDGNLVVLMSPDAPDYAQIGIVDSFGQLLDKGRYVGRTNGGRPTYRFSRPGAAYRGQVSVIAGNDVFPIGNPALRDENVAAGSLPTAQTQRTQAKPTAASQPQSGASLGGLALAGAAGLEKGDFKKAGNFLRGMVNDIKAPRFLERFGLGSSATSGGTTGGLFGNSAVTPATMTSTTPAWASAINAAAPVALGGFVGLKFADMLANWETSLQKWRRLSQEGYQAGKTGAERPRSLLNHFDVDSAPQQAYDLGKAGKPLQFAGGLNAKDTQRQQQATAKKNILSQGFDPKTVYQTNAGPTFTQKQKAAAKILKPATNSQVNMLNPYVLTDADRGGK